MKSATDDRGLVGMMSDVTLTEFLLARITEDEALARSAARPPWSLDSDGCCVGSEDHDATVAEMSWESAPHIARWDPARVLAECEAKRRIIHRISDVRWTGSRAVRNVVLELLALPYADHPDYRDEWRPE